MMKEKRAALLNNANSRHAKTASEQSERNESRTGEHPKELRSISNKFYSTHQSAVRSDRISVGGNSNAHGPLAEQNEVPGKVPGPMHDRARMAGGSHSHEFDDKVEGRALIRLRATPVLRAPFGTWTKAFPSGDNYAVNGIATSKCENL